MLSDEQEHTQKIMDALVELLRKAKLRISDEKKCQEDLEQFLLSEGLPFSREHHLSDGRSIIDFFFPRSGIGIEVKVLKNWGKMKIYRQCKRYCDNTELKGLILMTACPQGLPDIIQGKPAKLHFLGENALWS
ncbi:hypothetical protein G6355_12310 [Vibrio cholerae]|uniref:Uncharacterized protein n=1 Tax=Vibrio cholerae TaxID=666 RepID=A0ABD7STI7_VIBCL|nr:hypothetical protein [Vibrio cholerae]EGR2118897.1 hypothetical protein [Vibrio cholerae]KFE28820.1 hypothetical protein DN30_481 [Vibrio cholerae]MBY4641850.1 hypothetical protein [Vibrio cholerae]MCR9658122.1 hypothetical protein [Vibrio cholerae]MCR9688803.1 hypothetical protein [Vibrio cholerae]